MDAIYCHVGLNKEEVPKAQKDGFEAEGEEDGGSGDEPLSGVDRRSYEIAEDEPTDEPTDVSCVAHARDAEAYEEIDPGEQQKLADDWIARREGATPDGEPENAAQEAKDSTRGPDRRGIKRTDVQVRKPARDAAYEVEREEPGPSERDLRERAEEVRGKHVQRQVDETRVQEGARYKAPRLALRDQRRD